VLFGVVQLTMIGVGIARGERPGVREWGGLVLALCGLVWLTRPGSSAPDPLGTALMVAAGAAWASIRCARVASRRRSPPPPTTSCAPCRPPRSSA